MTRRARLVAPLVVVLALLGLTGCVRVPTSGAVNEAESSESASAQRQATFVPRGPSAGESATQVVDGFFAAMLASPMSAVVARTFLTEQDAARWAPERGYLTYSRRVVSGRAPSLQVRLEGVNHFDTRGAWTGQPGGGVLRLPLTVERADGSFRVAGVPDALIVSDDWFEQQTDPLSVYFFDPSGDSLVAEPVFVPQGVQRPTLPVHALLTGPVDPRVERSFVPAGTAPGLSVTLHRGGVAEVPLTGDLAALPPTSLERLAAQFAWTLRQVPGITSVRLSVNGRLLPVLGDQTSFDVTTGSGFDLAGLYPAGRLFGLRDGVVVSVRGDRAAPLEGQFGQRALGLRDVALDVGAEQVAGVSNDGRSLWTGSAGPSDDEPRQTLTGRTHLLRPAWDGAGRLWVVDRTSAGAVVLVAEAGGAFRAVDVRGVSGRQVTAILVSSDATRLVAVVRGRETDRVVQARLRPGRTEADLPVATRARRIAVGEGEPTRIRDMAWRNPTEVALLRTVASSYVLLDGSPLDGSPVAFHDGIPSDTFAADVTDLAGSGRVDEASYVGIDDADYVPAGVGGVTVPSDVRALAYVG